MPVYQLPLIAVSMRLAQFMRNVTTPARHVVSPRILCRRSKWHEIELESVVVYDKGQAREYVQLSANDRHNCREINMLSVKLSFGRSVVVAPPRLPAKFPDEHDGAL